MRYLPKFLSAEETRQLQAWLTTSAEICWQREHFQIFGKQVTAPRQLAWFGDPGLNYRYTGIDHMAQGWPRELKALRDRVASEGCQPFNFVLLNRYRHGGEHMGWHRDDEQGSEPSIASVSLGAKRRFRIRPGPGHASKAIDLAPGSLLFIDGRQQHMLAKTKRPVAERINLTFRTIHAH